MGSGAEVVDGDGVVVDLAELDADQSLSFFAGTFALATRAESNKLRVAAHWADLHSGDALEENTTALPGRERPRMIGGDGTPEIGEFCPDEFGAVAGLARASVTKLMADALDLRHRLPVIWARICRCEVPVWVCRKIAADTRHLTLDAARYVDAAVAPYLSSLTPGRVFTLVEAKIIEADPEDAEARARLAEAERFVRTGRTNRCGIKTLVARAEAGDVIMFIAICDRIAQILALKGDSDSADVRRSKAIGIIANPLRAIELLAEYEGREFTAPPEPRDDDLPDETPTPYAEPAFSGPEPDSTCPEPPPPHPEPDPPYPEPASSYPEPAPSYHEPDFSAAEPDVSIPEPAFSGTEPGEGLFDDPSDPDLEDEVIAESDLHPADREPYNPINYGHELQEILDRYGVTPKDLLPKTVIYLHLDRDTLLKDSGVVRVEDVGPITVGQFKHWLRGKHPTVTPVIDPANTPAVDAYETTDRLKNAMRMIMPAEAFPYGTNTGRRVDHDHANPYRPPPDGPPGQTSTKTQLRLARRSHRLKTHAGWQVRLPEPGTVLWRTPHGWYYLTNPAGTHPLGNGEYARTLWDTMINDFTAVRYPAPQAR